MFVVLGVAYHQILDFSTTLFIVLFTITQIFFNFGPNTTVSNFFILDLILTKKIIAYTDLRCSW
jgi:hypothetical protein